MTSDTQRTAIVTGASKGIGAAIARRLASNGINIVVNYSSSVEAAAQVAAEIQDLGSQAIAIKADIASLTGMATLFDAAEQVFGTVDILVNNAGLMHLGVIADFDDETFATQVDTNLGGTFRGMREAARRLRDGGRVINISSSVIGLYQPRYGVYAASKAAIEALTHVAAKEFGTRGITVNSVAPGPVETELFTEGKTEEQIHAIQKMNPMGRLGQPDDIASVVAFLASPSSGWINGQTIRANGGVV